MANSGMAGVVPAWKIAEVLQDERDDENLVKARQEAEREHVGRSEGGAVTDSIGPTAEAR